MTKMSNWQIWCRAVVKTEEGPLLHFCICWSGLSCNSLHSNNCQIFAKILLKISFEYFSKAPTSILSFFAPDVDRSPPTCAAVVRHLQKVVAELTIFQKSNSSNEEEEEKVHIIFPWGDRIYECFVRPKCTNKEKIRIFRQICFAHIKE